MTTEQVAPIIVERKKSEPRERQTRLSFVQNAESNLLHAYQRILASVDQGLNTYIEARNESIKAKGDEAYADTLPNLAKGLETVIKAIAPLPSDLVGIVYPDEVHQVVADTIHGVTNVIPTETASTKASE